jgi:hypothetical protein
MIALHEGQVGQTANKPELLAAEISGQPYPNGSARGVRNSTATSNGQKKNGRPFRTTIGEWRLANAPAAAAKVAAEVPGLNKWFHLSANSRQLQVARFAGHRKVNRLALACHICKEAFSVTRHDGAKALLLITHNERREISLHIPVLRYGHLFPEPKVG